MSNNNNNNNNKSDYEKMKIAELKNIDYKIKDMKPKYQTRFPVEILTPNWNVADQYQAISRGYRFRSHEIAEQKDIEIKKIESVVVKKK